MFLQANGKIKKNPSGTKNKTVSNRERPVSVASQGSREVSRNGPSDEEKDSPRVSPLNSPKRMSSAFTVGCLSVGYRAHLLTKEPNFCVEWSIGHEEKCFDLY